MFSIDITNQSDHPIPDCKPLIDWILMEYLSDYSVDLTVVYMNLSDEGVDGFCQRLSDYEFLIEIDHRLDGPELSKTILHELTHCLQHLKGIPRCETCCMLSEELYLERYGKSLSNE